MKNPYEDMLYLPHHVSPTRPQMNPQDRAAQFAPFAALTGYDDALDETARLTDEKAELSEASIEQINRRLSLLQAHCDEHPTVTMVYFLPDGRKKGGAYITTEIAVKEIDSVYSILHTVDKRKIPLGDIMELGGEWFEQFIEK